MLYYKDMDLVKYCECGCGEIVQTHCSPNRKYFYGHNGTREEKLVLKNKENKVRQAAEKKAGTVSRAALRRIKKEARITLKAAKKEAKAEIKTEKEARKKAEILLKIELKATKKRAKAELKAHAVANKVRKKRKLTEEHRKNLSISLSLTSKNTGKNHFNYGKKGKDNPNYGSKRTNKTKQKMSVTRIKLLKENPSFLNSSYTSGWYYSKKNDKELHYRSSYELQAYKLLEQMSEVVSYEAEPFSIPYIFEGAKRNYLIDLLVVYKSGRKELIEIKPEYFISEDKNQAKFNAAKEYSQDNNYDFSIWTEKELFN